MENINLRRLISSICRPRVELKDVALLHMTAKPYKHMDLTTRYSSKFHSIRWIGRKHVIIEKQILIDNMFKVLLIYSMANSSINVNILDCSIGTLIYEEWITLPFIRLLQTNFENHSIIRANRRKTYSPLCQSKRFISRIVMKSQGDSSKLVNSNIDSSVDNHSQIYYNFKTEVNIRLLLMHLFDAFCFNTILTYDGHSKDKLFSFSTIYHNLSKYERSFFGMIYISILTSTVLANRYPLKYNSSSYKLTSVNKKVYDNTLTRLFPLTIVAVSMDMCTGKTYLCNKYPNIFVDIDSITYGDESNRISKLLYDFDPNKFDCIDWIVVAKVTAEIFLEYLSKGNNLKDKILLIHNLAFAEYLPGIKIVNLGVLALDNECYAKAYEERCSRYEPNSKKLEWFRKIAKFNRSPEYGKIPKLMVSRHIRDVYLSKLIELLYRSQLTIEKTT